MTLAERIEAAAVKMRATTTETECWDCSGRKVVDGRECTVCGGSGVNIQYEPKAKAEYDYLCEQQDRSRRRW